MDELQDDRFYLQKALEAEQRAETAILQNDRDGFLYLASQYRAFAEQLRSISTHH